MNVTLIQPKFYYGIDRFYANHRNFVKSRSYRQLEGKVATLSEVFACEPIVHVSDLLDLDSVY